MQYPGDLGIYSNVIRNKFSNFGCVALGKISSDGSFFFVLTLQKMSLLFSNFLYSVTIPYLDCLPLYVKFREYIYKYSVDFFGVLKKLYYGAYVNIFLFLLPDHKLALTPGFET